MTLGLVLDERILDRAAHQPRYGYILVARQRDNICVVICIKTYR